MKMKIDPMKEQYRELLMKHWNDIRMVNYLMKDYTVLFELDGGLAVIDKPKIQTRFCFGYHHYDESMNDAQDAADYARESVEHFKRENFKDIDGWIKNLEDSKGQFPTWVACVRNRYWKESAGLKTVCFVNRWELENKGQEARPLTTEEIDIVIEAYKKARAAFEKRLNTYLKRYGMSKVETWTYWRDE